MAHFKPYERDSKGAQKRIQGEDVFGNKIKVLSPSVRSYTGQEVQVPITLDRSAPNIRPITKRGVMGPPQMEPPSVLPMEISLDQLQGAFNRKTPASRQRTPQEQLSAALGQVAGALPPYGQVHNISGSEYSDTNVKGCIPVELSTKNQGNQPIDVNISNLDPTIDVKELGRLLSNMIKEYAMILNLSVIVQADGTPIAHLIVSSQQEAQFTISQLDRQKLGNKRIVISYAQTNSPDIEQLRAMVISVLQAEKKPMLESLFEKHYKLLVANARNISSVINQSQQIVNKMLKLAGTDLKSCAELSDDLKETMGPGQDSSDSNDLGTKDFEGLNLSDCTGARPKFRFSAPPRRAVRANNSYCCSSQSDGSSTSSINKGRWNNNDSPLPQVLSFCNDKLLNSNPLIKGSN